MVCIGTILVARRGIGESIRAIAGLSRAGRLSLLLASVMGLTLNLAMFSAFNLIPIALALMLFYTYPAGVAVVDVAMGHERITAPRLAALGLSTLGVGLVLAGGLNPGDGAATQPVAPLGIVLGLTAAAAQVVFVTASRHGYRSVPADGATFVNIGASLIGATVVALAIGQADGLAAPLRSLDPWPVILLAGVVAAGMSSLLFLTAIRLIGGTRTGILMLLEPVVGVVLAALWLGEALVPVQLAGGALVLLGALVLQLGSDPDHEPVIETAAGPVV
jgi:drug/metabolite transporter (DMT)-like permease